MPRGGGGRLGGAPLLLGTTVLIKNHCRLVGEKGGLFRTLYCAFIIIVSSGMGEGWGSSVVESTTAR